MSLPDSNPVTTTGEGTANAEANVADTTTQNPVTGAPSSAPDLSDPGKLAAAAALPPAYQPNYKYKAAMQEKELEEFWRPLVKDADSEKKVKALFSKVDAFDFVNQKREHFEKEFNSLSANYQDINGTVGKFNDSVKNNDLSGAFRLAGISRDQVFRWTQQQLQIMELPPEQRAVYERAEQEAQQRSSLEEQIQGLRGQYEDQAVQNRTMQLETSLLRPEVQKFADAWDQNAEQPGAFREFVVQEARRIWHETKQDISPPQAVQMVMQKFGRFLNVDNSTQPPQTVPATIQRQAPPVIPNITGKAASPIKKVARSLDDIRKAAKELG